jgi:3-hydroxyacyl-[acyl-carrier-protein] dehydratase
MNRTASFSRDDICSILPHRPPFLFVDRVIKLVPDKEIEAERDIKDDEPFFAGHFPQRHIMPGVLVIDALAQTSGLLWGLSKKATGAVLAKEPSPVGQSTRRVDVEAPHLFFLASSTMKFVNPSFPGETLTLLAWSQRSFGALFNYAVEAHVKRRLIAKGNLTLAMMDDASKSLTRDDASRPLEVPDGVKSTPSGASKGRLTRDGHL